MTRTFWFLLLACCASACGSALPGRYVIERDLDGFAYRRYQKTLGIEVPIEGNEAVGHTATYLKREQSDQPKPGSAYYHAAPRRRTSPTIASATPITATTNAASATNRPIVPISSA